MFDDLDDEDSEDSEDLTEEEMSELAEWELDWDSLSEEQADAIEQIFLQVRITKRKSSNLQAPFSLSRTS